MEQNLDTDRLPAEAPFNWSPEASQDQMRREALLNVGELEAYPPMVRPEIGLAPAGALLGMDGMSVSDVMK